MVNVGPLTLTVQADPSRGQALIKVVLANATVDTQLLTYTNAKVKLDVANGQASATGIILLKLEPSPQFSAVNTDVVAINQGAEYPFKGALKSWVAKGEPVVGDYALMLAADLSTLTTVRGVAANIADFSFFVGTQSVALLTAMQLASVQKLPKAIVAGDVRIKAGAQISLTIPTTLEKGFLFLTAEFRTLTTPLTPVGASIANWSLP